MRVRPIDTIEKDDAVRVQADVEWQDERATLWYEFPKAYRDHLVTERMDGFLVALILPAMKTGESIHLDGPVSEKLYYSLSTYYTRLLRLAIPVLKSVEIFPGCLDSRPLMAAATPGIGTGYSAGIDSFCCIYDHSAEECCPSYKLTHLVFNNAGSHGPGEEGRTLFHQRYDIIQDFPAQADLELIKIDSNLSDFIGMNFQKTHVPRNLSSILILQKLFSKYYLASSYRYEDCFLGEAYDIAYMDPAAVHLLSTESLEFISSGCQYSRVEKTDRVAEYPPSYDFLNVCVDPAASGRNCSACWKCNRTLVTLEMLGKLERYSRVFDLERYRAGKKYYVRKVLKKNRNDPLNREILERGRELQYTL